ncbi:hypothetical protein [Dyella flagellata]|uniref:Uncharacterized protein n=1 Tax=Dyella flagellata TaxID=1867833 RepID=A0ABQ5X8E3_9GAMM|nr:hypothetical protein [Dyella flagellata]GLQ87899.1 hypothetical protein GCM10007898_14670 [Dyella flagellata]
MKQLIDLADPSPAPNTSTASGPSTRDFDQLYYQPKRFSQRESDADKGGTPLFLVWFSALFVLNLALSRFSFAKFDLATGIGYALGIALVALIIAGIRRIFTANAFGKAYLISMAILTVLYFGGGLLKSVEVANSRQQAFQHLADVASATAASSSSARSTVPTNQTYVEANGDALTNTVNQLSANLSQYNQHIIALKKQKEALDLEAVLAPRNLVSTAGIQNGRDTIASYGRLLDDYESSFNDYENKVMQIVSTAPSASREHITAGVQQRLAQARDAVSGFVGVERQLIATINDILDLAQANVGTSHAKGNVIYLPKPALLQYQRDIAVLRTEAAQEQQASERLAQIRSTAISELTTASQAYGNR